MLPPFGHIVFSISPKSPALVGVLHPPILVWALFRRLSVPFLFLTRLAHLPSPFLHCGKEFQAFLPTQSPSISI